MIKSNALPKATKPSAFRKGLKLFSKQKYIFLVLAPGLIWFVLFKYAPLWYISMAFTDYGTTATPSFIGLENFTRLFLSPNFKRAFFNTLILSFYQIVFYFPMPIILALAMNEIRSKFFKRTVQFTVYIPYFFSWVVVGGLFTIMLSPQDGIVNEMIKAMGGEPIFFMASTKWFRTVLISSQLWKDVGYGTVIYVAAISTIDQELYDAASVDGAGYLAKTWHITLPSIRGTIATVLLLNISKVMQIFEQVLVMSNDSVKDVSDVLRTYSYYEGMQRGDIGYATAIGLFTSVISLILILGCNLFSKKVLKEEIL